MVKGISRQSRTSAESGGCLGNASKSQIPLILSLQLADDIVPASIRNDRRTRLPEHAVPVAFHVDVAAGTQQGHGICVSSDFRRIAIAGKG